MCGNDMTIPAWWAWSQLNAGSYRTHSILSIAVTKAATNRLVLYGGEMGGMREEVVMKLVATREELSYGYRLHNLPAEREPAER